MLRRCCEASTPTAPKNSTHRIGDKIRRRKTMCSAIGGGRTEERAANDGPNPTANKEGRFSYLVDAVHSDLIFCLSSYRRRWRGGAAAAYIDLVRGAGVRRRRAAARMAAGKRVHATAPRWTRPLPGGVGLRCRRRWNRHARVTAPMPPLYHAYTGTSIFDPCVASLNVGKTALQSADSVRRKITISPAPVCNELVQWRQPVQYFNLRWR